MPHPWKWDQDWVEEGLEYYNLTPSSPDWNAYERSVGAYYYNSLGFPTEVGLFVLGLFGFVVLLAAVRKASSRCVLLHRYVTKNAFIKSVNVHIVQAPLLKKKHQKPLHLLGPFLSIQLPLRVDSLCLLVIALINLLSIVSMYKPYRENNLYWPDSYSELLRYVSDRSGVLATMQFPLLFLLSGRNNLVSWLTGASFDKCMLYHRWIARFIFVQVVVHAGGYSIVYAKEASYSIMFDDPYMRWGTAATVSFGPLIFLSLRWLRQQAYEVFVAVHIAMAVVCVIGTYYHIQLLNVQVAGQYNDFIYVIYASVAFWSFDKLIRLARITRYTVNVDRNKKLSVSRAQLSIICTSSRGTVVRHVIRLNAPHLNVGGQFVQLWLPTIEPFTSHPFTVADVVECGEQGNEVVLYSKVHAGATKKLLNAVTINAQKWHLALVEGFYGRTPDLLPFQHVLFASAGIGITLCMPLFKRRLQSGHSAHMIWVVPEHEMLVVLADMLKRISPSLLLGQSSKVNTECIQAAPLHAITVYVTQRSYESHVKEVDESSSVDGHIAVLDQQASSTGDEEDAANVEKMENNTDLRQLASAAGIALRIVNMHGRRPALHTIIGDAASAFKSTCLVSCGPDTFCDDSRRACRTHGVHYFEEAFQW